MTEFKPQEVAIVAGIIGLMALIPITCQSAKTIHIKEYEATVTEKTVKRYDRNNDKYLIFTKLNNGNVRVFENTDNLLRGKFNSSDLYAKIQQGKEYRFETCGWRIPFLSMYENIIRAEEINHQK
jgi:hypothetical protein